MANESMFDKEAIREYAVKKFCDIQTDDEMFGDDCRIDGDDDHVSMWTVYVNQKTGKSKRKLVTFKTTDRPPRVSKEHIDSWLAVFDIRCEGEAAIEAAVRTGTTEDVLFATSKYPQAAYNHQVKSFVRDVIYAPHLALAHVDNAIGETEPDEFIKKHNLKPQPSANLNDYPEGTHFVYPKNRKGSEVYVLEPDHV